MPVPRLQTSKLAPQRRISRAPRPFATAQVRIHHVTCLLYALILGSPRRYYACGWPYPDGRVCEKEFASPQNLAAHKSSVQYVIFPPLIFALQHSWKSANWGISASFLVAPRVSGFDAISAKCHLAPL